jgi:hypothetical protein
LPDSLVLVAGQGSLRLESYLFTLEAMRAAKSHLNPHGAFAMYNYYRQQWLVDRLATTLQTTYGHAPCIDSYGRYGRLAVLMDAPDGRDISCGTRWSLAMRADPPPVSDDYPFLYLQNRAVPRIYAITLAAILIVSLLAVRFTAGSFEQMRGSVDLFFMGAAFLLLETKNVVQFALLFGTTWLVNALVFFGILLSVFAAIEVARRVRVGRPQTLYVALFVALFIAWLVPPEALLLLPIVARFVAAVALAFAPIFLANLIFAERFRDSASSTVAFGANLLGAMVGGVLEYSAMLVGYRSLLLLVAALYVCAFIFGRRYLQAGKVQPT